VFLDYLPRKRPILYFVYDREIYERDRGTYFPMEELPGRLCSSMEELVEGVRTCEDEIRENLPKYEAAIGRFCSEDDGRAARRVVDEVFLQRSRGRSFSVVNSDKKTVLFYSASLLNNGITSSLMNLIRNLDPKRFNVLVIDKDKLEPEGERNVRRLPAHARMFFRTGIMSARLRERLSEQLGVAGPLERKKEVPWSAYRRELRRLLGDAKIDCYVDFSGYSKFWAMLFASAEAGRKSIYQHNDMLAEYQKKKHQNSFNVIFHIYDRFDRVICVGKHTRDINVANMRPFLQDAARRIVVVHNCIDSEAVNAPDLSEVRIGDTKYWIVEQKRGSGSLDVKLARRPKKGEKIFVTLGRLWPEKDHKKLIEAFAQVYARHPEVRLYILGEGVLRQELQEQVAHLGLEDAVFLAGHIPSPFPLLRESDCFVLSSNYEGQPMVLLEAMTLGMPILCTDIPGTRSAVECGYGRLVENSTEALRDGMLEFLDGKVKGGQFSVEEYNRAAMEMFHREVCGEHNGDLAREGMHVKRPPQEEEPDVAACS
jgi:CDP-glycerol glycerophosphotransferase